MTAPDFQAAIGRVLRLAEEKAVALMCAEAVPWRCHRALIADLLVARGHEVTDILAPGRADPHRLSAHAVVTADGGVVYPPPPPPQGELFGG